MKNSILNSQPSGLDAILERVRREEADLRERLRNPAITPAERAVLELELAQVAKRATRKLQPVPPPAADWRSRLDGLPGAYLASPNNVAIALEQSPEWGDNLRWDEFSFTASLERDVELRLRNRDPVLIPAGGVPEWATHSVQCWLDYSGMPRVSAELVEGSLAAVSRRRPFHPVAEYLVSVWQAHGLTYEQSRAILEGFWPRYFNVASPPCEVGLDCGQCASCLKTAAVRVAGVCWPVSAVARILPGSCGLYARPDANRPDRRFGPGCLVKYVPVLMGDQDMAKSSALAALSPRPDWVTDTRIDLIDPKKLGEVFRAHWLVELAEIDQHFREGGGGQLKAVISSRGDTFREAYARHPADHPRQSVMIGTTNHVTFLRDPDNTVRFWPLEVTQPIDTLPIATDRDLIWAAAVTCYVHGEPWWPVQQEASALRSVAEASLDSPAWADLLSTWCAQPSIPSGWQRTDCYRMIDIIACSGLASLHPAPTEAAVRRQLQLLGWRWIGKVRPVPGSPPVNVWGPRT